MIANKFKTQVKKKVRNNKAKESRKKEHTQESELENNKPTE
jgi:hypothetical protein